MEPEQVYEAMREALRDADQEREENAPRVSVGMMAIAPFDAENTDGEPVRAIGVVTNPALDMLEFVVLKTLESGEIFPTTEGSLWAPGAPS